MQVPDPKALFFFLLRFAILFGLLVFPWPGFREWFARGLQSELGGFFHLTLPCEEVEVRYGDRATYKSGDTEIRRLAGGVDSQHGQMAVITLVCDSRSLGWMPHAMVLALCGATPLGWRRWWRLVLGALLGTHLLVLATFTAGLLSIRATEIPSSLVYWLVVGANHVLVENLWISFGGPFLLWTVAWVVFGAGLAEDTWWAFFGRYRQGLAWRRNIKALGSKPCV